MRKNKSFSKYIAVSILLLPAILFVAKFGGPSILRLYVEAGIGSCQKIPILCMVPDKEIINPNINKEYIAELLPYNFAKMAVSVPEGFTVIQEKIKKVYYKKGIRKQKETVIYLLHKEPNFFINLFPQVTKQGVIDDYEFIKRTMYAKLKDIKNLTDAFFVIMKGIFIPDLGEQRNVKMAQFRIADKKGFINYNLTQTDNYFDCNVINNEGTFFKIYIKDKGASLNLERVLAIISTINKVE